MYPKPCANCARILRPGRTTIEEYPGTEATHHAIGLCNACYQRPNRVQRTYPRPCDSCDRTMRPCQSNIEAYPTAVVEHAAHGLCQTCYELHHRTKGKLTTEQIKERIRQEQIRHDNTVAGLENFMRLIRGKSRV